MIPIVVVRGLIRLVPTSVDYMMAKFWPDLCAQRALPKSERIWESSRVCVDRTYDANARKIIMPELLCAVQEFCQANDYEAAVGVTRKHLLEHYFPGKVQWLGGTAEVEGQAEAAFWIPTGDMRPVAHCSKYRIPNHVLSFEPILRQVAA